MMYNLLKRTLELALNKEGGHDRLRMAGAFFAGMIITAVIAQITPLASVFYPQPVHNFITPAPADIRSPEPEPDSTPDTRAPVESLMKELVFNYIGEVSPG